MTKRKFDALIKKIESMTPAQKVRFAEAMFTDVQCDNYGQVLVYTGLRFGKNGRLRRLRDSDFV